MTLPQQTHTQLSQAYGEASTLSLMNGSVPAWSLP